MSNNTEESPLGNILKTTHNMDGTSQVRIDNGPTHTITIVTHTELLGDLTATDMRSIRDHLMSRKPGHFRVKKKPIRNPSDIQWP